MQEFSPAMGGKDSEYAFQAWRKYYPKSVVINKDGLWWLVCSSVPFLGAIVAI